MPGLNIAIDLGTSTTTAFVQGKGIVFSESTAICYDAYDNEVVCVGDTAGEMSEKTPESLILKKPVVVASFIVTMYALYKAKLFLERDYHIFIGLYRFVGFVLADAF